MGYLLASEPALAVTLSRTPVATRCPSGCERPLGGGGIDLRREHRSDAPPSRRVGGGDGRCGWPIAHVCTRSTATWSWCRSFSTVIGFPSGTGATYTDGTWRAHACLTSSVVRGLLSKMPGEQHESPDHRWSGLHRKHRGVEVRRRRDRCRDPRQPADRPCRIRPSDSRSTAATLRTRNYSTKIFTDHPDIGATVHCAALIVVGDSVSSPARYYENNVSKSLALVSSVLRNGCGRFVFSSSAAVYAPGKGGCVDESSPDRTAESLRAQQSSVRNHARRHRGSNRFVGDISPILQSGRSRSGTAKRNTIGTPDARTRKALRIIFDRNTFQSDRERIGRRATGPECVITFMSGTLQMLMFEHCNGSTESPPIHRE